MIMKFHASNENHPKQKIYCFQQSRKNKKTNKKTTLGIHKNMSIVTCFEKSNFMQAHNVP